MNFKQSHYLIRTIMPAVKSKSTFAVIAAVADSTWGWKTPDAVLSISQLAELTGLSQSGVRKCINDQDFAKYVNRVQVDPQNVLLGFRYSMGCYVTEEHSDTTQSNKVPFTEEHSDTTQSNKATSGSKEELNNIKKKSKEERASISNILPPHFAAFESQNESLTQEEQHVFDFLVGICRTARPATIKQHALTLVREKHATIEVLQSEFNSRSGYWYTQTSDGKANKKPHAGHVVNEWDSAAAWRETKAVIVIRHGNEYSSLDSPARIRIESTGAWAT